MFHTNNDKRLLLATWKKNHRLLLLQEVFSYSTSDERSEQKQTFKKKSWKLVYEKMNFQLWKKSAHLWMSAVCLHFQLFVYFCQLFVYFSSNFSRLFTFCQLFVYIFKCFFLLLSAVYFYFCQPIFSVYFLTWKMIGNIC